MRESFQRITSEFISQNQNSMLLLGDIGVYGFRETIKNFPDRAMNIGILEQATVSFSAGLASRGFHPIVHSIAPFIVERCLEQIKLDFGYQRLAGTFVSVGGSYDYSRLGASHHCPADISLFAGIPGSTVWAPSSEEELDRILQIAYSEEALSYIRLSERSFAPPINMNEADQGLFSIRVGQRAGLIVSIGDTFQNAVKLAENFDVSLAYVNRPHPFPMRSLVNAFDNLSKLIILEPGYSGSTLFSEPQLASLGRVHSLGVSRAFIHEYGEFDEVESSIGLGYANLHRVVEKILNED